MTHPSRTLLPLAVLLTLGGCGSATPTTPAAEHDPAVAGALAGEIMVDPDLAGQNPANAALAGGGVARAAIPTQDRSPEAIAAARAEAASQLGGALLHAPAAVAGAGQGGSASALLTARGALAESGTGRDCVSKVDYTMAWAARLPAAFPVYPRGHVQEAAGTDNAGCRLRVVNFVSPVPVDDLVDYYWSRARAAGFAAEHRREGTDQVVGGSKGAEAFVAYVRERGGMSEVDLVTNGS